MKKISGMHIKDNRKYCARCWDKLCWVDGLCKNCGEELKPIYENNGFEEPTGPSHLEVVGFEPCAQCGEVKSE